MDKDRFGRITLEGEDELLVGYKAAYRISKIVLGDQITNYFDNAPDYSLKLGIFDSRAVVKGLGAIIRDPISPPLHRTVASGMLADISKRT